MDSRLRLTAQPPPPPRTVPRPTGQTSARSAGRDSECTVLNMLHPSQSSRSPIPIPNASPTLTVCLSGLIPALSVLCPLHSSSGVRYSSTQLPLHVAKKLTNPVTYPTRKSMLLAPICSSLCPSSVTRLRGSRIKISNYTAGLLLLTALSALCVPLVSQAHLATRGHTRRRLVLFV